MLSVPQIDTRNPTIFAVNRYIGGWCTVVCFYSYRSIYGQLFACCVHSCLLAILTAAC